MRRFFRQFSFPGGIGSHCTPETPGSIHEGGELGYSLSHGYGAAFDNPDLIVTVCRRRRSGDRSARHLMALEQIPESRSRRRGAAGPASERLQDRQPDHPRADPARNSKPLLTATATTRILSKATIPTSCISRWPRRSNNASGDPRDPAESPREAMTQRRPRWPMIVLRSPKGWTGPKEVDGHKVEGLWRAHQVPVPRSADE